MSADAPLQRPVDDHHALMTGQLAGTAMRFAGAAAMPYVVQFVDDGEGNHLAGFEVITDDRTYLVAVIPRPRPQAPAASVWDDYDHDPVGS